MRLPQLLAEACQRNLCGFSAVHLRPSAQLWHDFSCERRHALLHFLIGSFRQWLRRPRWNRNRANYAENRVFPVERNSIKAAPSSSFSHSESGATESFHKRRWQPTQAVVCILMYLWPCMRESRRLNTSSCGPRSESSLRTDRIGRRASSYGFIANFL